MLLLVVLAAQAGILRPGFRVAKYVGKHGWITVEERALQDDAELAELLQRSYDASVAVRPIQGHRRLEVDLYGTWWERLPALAFPSEHPFHHSLIGSMEHLSDATLEDVADFFRTFYTPDNAIIVAVGDFEVGALEREVRAKYAPWKSKRAKSEIKAEPPQTKEIRDRIEWKTPTLPLLSLSWRTPQLAVGSVEAAVYSVLFELMFGETSAIHSELVLEKQTVDRFNDGSGERRDPYLFHVVAVVKDPAAMKRFGNTMVVWNLKSMQPTQVLSVPGAPLEIRWGLAPGQNWAVTATALTSSPIGVVTPRRTSARSPPRRR